MAKLSSLIVDLQADTASLKSGLDDAKRMIGDLNKKVDSATKTLSAMFVLDKVKQAIGGLASFVHAGAEAADVTGKMAQSAGMTVEAFSRLDYAASLSLISTEDLGVAMSKLNKQLGAAQQGGKDQQAIFKSLGISLKDASGHMRSADAVMGDIAERFAGMADGSAKSALAIEIFGKSGARMIPLLNQGKAGLKEMADEADRFGFTVTAKGAKSAEEFNDSIRKMENIGKGLSRAVAEDLTPSLTALSTEMLNSLKNTDSLKIAAEGIAIVFRGLVSAGIIVAGTFQHIGITIAGLASAAVNLVHGDFRGAKASLQAMGNEIGANFDAIQARLQATFATTQSTTQGEVAAHKTSADAIVAAIARKKKAMEDYDQAVKKLEKTTIEMQQQVFTFGKNDVEILQQKLLFGDLTEEIKKAGKQGEKFAEQMLEAAKALRELKLAEVLKQIGLEHRTHEGAQFRETPEQAATAGGFAFNAPQPITHRSPEVLKAEAKMLASGVDFSRTIQGALGVMADGILNGLKKATLGLLGAMGGIGSIVGNFIQTFQSEGFWEALIGAIGEIIAAAPAFGQVVDIAAGILKYIVGALDGLIGAIGTLLGALGGVIEIIINALAPLFDGLAQFLTDLAPILFIIGETLKVSITPLAKALGSAFKALSPVLKILFDVIKGIVLFSFYILRALGNAWNGIVGAISGFLRLIGNITIFGGKPFAALLGWADSVDKAKITMVGLENSIKELEDTNYDMARSQQDARTEEYKAAGASDKAAKSMNDVAKAAAGLTNVPALLKVNRLRGLSADATGGTLEVYLYMDGKQIFTTVSKYSKTSRYNKDGSRAGGL